MSLFRVQEKRTGDRRRERMEKKTRLICNLCGKDIGESSSLIKEDYLLIQKNWGYFSKKDGQRHSICLCETCYDQWITTFCVPVLNEDQTELL